MLDELINPYLGQEAQQGLHVVSSQGVADERHGPPSHRLQEARRVERRQLAGRRPPPPLQELGVRPPVLHAVLVLLDREAGGVRVAWGIRVANPFALGEIASGSNPKGRGRRRGMRVAEGSEKTPI